MSYNLQEQDCAVCLQKIYHPTQLPCGHIFCFLCVKGVTIQNRKCAMCRCDIPLDYLDHPVLLKTGLPENTTSECGNVEFQWYYEGRNGWWKYDERSNTELENAFSSGQTNCTLLLAGALYRIDFQSMVQVRRGDHTRRRRVRRDTPQLPAKGIAGIKIIADEQLKSEENETETPNNSIGVGSPAEDEVIVISDEDESSSNIVNDAIISQEVDVEVVIENLSTFNLEDPTDSVDIVQRTEDVC